ncbi:MAG: hypothetical protein D6732_10105 [Methanobacteriota archaeon]|nr:MAG: hypothetical protein D6732_10105 [Euryarchaeota archaeon]
MFHYMNFSKKVFFVIAILILGTAITSTKGFSSFIVHQPDDFNPMQLVADSYEPDDDANSSTQIPLGTLQNHTIYPAGDNDWLTFNISESMTVTIETFVGVDTVLELYNENLTYIASDDDSGSGLAALIYIDLEPGVYYVKVTAFGSSSTGEYQISVTGYSLYDAYEPDDSYQNATRLEFNQTQSHSIYPVGEADWYYFMLNRTISVTIETVVVDVDTYMFLYDSGLNQLTRDDDSGIGLSARIISILQAGTYYVKVEGYANSSTGNYSISLNESNMTDLYEPDNDYLNATVIYGDTFQSHSLYPEDDRDWLTLTVSENSTLDIIVDPQTQGLDTVVYLYDDSLNVIGSDDNSGFNNGSHLTSSIGSGTYYIEVFGATSNQMGNYYLSVSITSGSADPYEPDNDFNSATPLFFDIPQNHSLVPGNDTDFFVFNVTQQGIVTIDTFGDTGDPIMYLYDENQNQIDFNDDSGSLFPRISRTLTPGTYYVQISPYGGFGLVPWYTISITFVNYTVTGDDYEPDNSMDLANEITIGETQEHSLTSYDIDFVFFVLTTTMRVSIYTSGDLGDTIMTLYDNAGNQIAFDDDNGKGLFASVTLLLDPGTYYAAVEAFDTSVPINSYFITLREGVDPDEYEDDNDFSQATQLQFWETQDHTFSENDYRDFFIFNISQMMEVEIETSGTDGDTSIIIFDEFTNYIADADDTSTSTFATISLMLDAGTYYVEVIGYYSFAYSITLKDPNSSPPTSSESSTSITNTTVNTKPSNGTSSSGAPALDLPIDPLASILGLMTVVIVLPRLKKQKK